ncbi:hypothetical protein AA102526_1507 [Asaia lannensis NBRC 102526]|nr:hypothetical protein AA102526_1507 [Asaia lannensis NBRC 102526]
MPGLSANLENWCERTGRIAQGQTEMRRFGKRGSDPPSLEPGARTTISDRAG